MSSEAISEHLISKNFLGEHPSTSDQILLEDIKMIFSAKKVTDSPIVHSSKSSDYWQPSLLQQISLFYCLSIIMTKSTFPVSPSQASPMQLQFCSMQERSEYEDETSAGGEHFTKGSKSGTEIPAGILAACLEPPPKCQCCFKF